MKFILLLLALILATQQIRINHDFEASGKVGSKYSGISRNWKQFDKNTFYIDVDFSEFNFPNVPYLPYVITFMTCDADCTDVSGVNSIYNLSNKGFRVYVSKVDPNSEYTLEQVKKNNWAIQWFVGLMRFV